MKILIIGAGAAGSIIAKLLADKTEVEQVIVGDIDQSKARKFLTPSSKITFKILDAKDPAAVVSAAKSFNLLINASLPEFNEILMKAALEARVNYQDLASGWEDGEIEQLKYAKDFQERNLKAVINASASPGVTNLVAKELASKLKRIEYVKVRLLEDVNSDVPFTAWSKAIFFDEIWHKPLAWEFDRFVAKNNFSEEEIYDFPEPFLNKKCYLLAQEDIGTIPLYIKTKYADLKAGGSEMEFARTLFKLGLFKKRQVKIGDAMVAPYDVLLKVWPDVPAPKDLKNLVEYKQLRNAHFWAAVEERGFRDKKKVTKKAIILFPDQVAINQVCPGANYVSYAAGLSAAIFALAIPNIKEYGVFPPEALSDEIRAQLIDELKNNNIKIEITEKY